MKFLHILSVSSFLLITLSITLANAASFDIKNNCPYTVWAVAVPSGGRQLGQGYGAPPNTLVEYPLKQYMDMDFIDMSNIDGLNVPMEFSSVSGGCNRVIKCMTDIIGQCPNELKVSRGCNEPCPVFKTEEHCCNFGNCGPTTYS
ncbi:hypothetical protein Pint_16091 [Pistacia integerrima]|uniref:Uncharacterized protein n=1 Tax=Pistacia integerrima TaxID=434235 RepID=A0ACC0ZCG7_9ROSI|nr:hypothetical protein Pint_16091 [Pistacia integerrima]